jgi:hypothetical protein
MISSTSSTDRIARTDSAPAAGQPAARPFTQRPDQFSTESASFLKAALLRQPEIRPEVVERARALAADPNYPSPEILKKVGATILRAPDLSEDAS